MLSVIVYSYQGKKREQALLKCKIMFHHIFFFLLITVTQSEAVAAKYALKTRSILISVPFFHNISS